MMFLGIEWYVWLLGIAIAASIILVVWVKLSVYIHLFKKRKNHTDSPENHNK
jgi:hypothetical protein